MQKSPEAQSDSTTTVNEVSATVGDVIHQWTPHDPLMVFSASIGFLILAVLFVGWQRRKLASPLKAEDYWRIGFAAGPIPVYLLLPLAPFDPDLAHALLSQPFSDALGRCGWGYVDGSRCEVDFGTGNDRLTLHASKG